MGYYTQYSLTSDHPELEGEMEVSLSELSGYGISFDDNEPCKWYGHEKDMRELSKKYPEVRFMLEGEGEESGDLWIKYFKSGKMQFCPAKITYEEFDENKLK